MKAKKHLIFVGFALSTVTAIVVTLFGLKIQLIQIKEVAYDVYLQSADSLDFVVRFGLS